MGQLVPLERDDQPLWLGQPVHGLVCKFMFCCLLVWGLYVILIVIRVKLHCFNREHRWLILDFGWSLFLYI